MRLEIKKLQRRLGITTIFVTHDQTEALTMADKIAVMYKGKICEIGTPIEIYEKPKTEFAAKFIGERNIFDGEIMKVNESSIILRTFGGLNLRASRESLDTNASKGGKVLVTINPWGIKIYKQCPNVAINLLEGVIKEIVYLGSESEYVISVKDETLKVRLNNVEGKTVFSNGDTVYVEISPTCIHALPK